MSKLVMLTEAADLVESKTYEEIEVNGKGTNHTNGVNGSESCENPTQNGNHVYPYKTNAGALPSSNSNHNDKGNRGDSNRRLSGNSTERATTIENSPRQDPQRYYNYPQNAAYPERRNGNLQRPEHGYPKTAEDSGAARKSPERLSAIIPRRATSPASDRGGDQHATTKPMVLLQQPAATTLSSAGPAHPARITNPGIPLPGMQHPWNMYPLLYQSAPGLESVLGPAMSRAPGVLKEQEGLVSSPNRSPNDGLTSVSAAGLHLPGLMYPLPNHPTLLMPARPPGADISPMLAANPYPAVALEQYKRMMEGMQFSYPGLNPQLTDQYLKTLVATQQGLDMSKDALALSAMAGRLQPGLSLAGQPELLLRYPEHWPAAMGMLRPPAGVSPGSGSPFQPKRRTESPNLANGSKSTAPSYPFHHPSLVQSQINSSTAGLIMSRSPASIFSSQGGQGSRSPAAESARKPDPDRSGYRPRDMEQRDAKQARGRSGSGEQVPPYSVTDENGRKIPVPAFYIPHSSGLTAHHVARERSPSPRMRDERAPYHRPVRDRSPNGLDAKRRSLENHHHHLARGSPIAHDRHNSRPASPLSNGLAQTSRAKIPNGTADAATVSAELPKHGQHLMMAAAGHSRSPNPAAFGGGDAREQRNDTPPLNPYLVAGMPPFLNPQLMPALAGHPGAHYMLSGQLAQALAAKGGDLASVYKAGEQQNSEYTRFVSLQLQLQYQQQQQQQLLAGARLPQDYPGAALKTAAYYSPQGKDGGKSSPAAARDRPMPMQARPKSNSPTKTSAKANDSPQMGKPAHQRQDPHSPPAEPRHYHQSPSVADRPARDASPKQASSKPYRPNPMLRQHAPDLERNRKRKLMEEEMAMREEGGAFVREKFKGERDYHHAKDDRRDPKRVKQLISENDPEEHFRRSLGKDYKETSNKVNISGSVDEHFKKALGPMYEQVHGGKGEPRDPAPAHLLPPYSVAVAAASAGRLYSAHPDAKETRFYEQPFLPRDRYYLQAASPHQSRKPEKSPPGPTVIYPPGPAPARQKVKAKSAFIPEAGSARANSDNGKCAPRADSVQTSANKSPSTSSPPAAPQSHPYPYAHPPNDAAAQRVRDSPHGARNADCEDPAKARQSADGACDEGKRAT